MDPPLEERPEEYPEERPEEPMAPAEERTEGAPPLRPRIWASRLPVPRKRTDMRAMEASAFGLRSQTWIIDVSPG
jgi:hypothetical protein